MANCECCRDRDAQTYTTMGKYRANLCQRCADTKHALNNCLLCGERCWSCAQFAHVAEAHSHYVLTGSNMPNEVVLPAKPSMLKKIGTLRFVRGGSLPGGD